MVSSWKETYRRRPAKSWIGGIQNEITRIYLPDDLCSDRQGWRLGVAKRPPGAL